MLPLTLPKPSPLISAAIMLTSSDIIYLLNIARESYTFIIGTPSDNDVVRLPEAILTIIYSIYLGADAGCPPGLILAYAAYTRSLGTIMGFDCMIDAYKLYDPSIEYDATDGL